MLQDVATIDPQVAFNLLHVCSCFFRLAHIDLSTPPSLSSDPLAVQKCKPVTRSENGGVRKTIIVDLTSGRRPRWVARYVGGEGGGGGGGCCECPLETIPGADPRFRVYSQVGVGKEGACPLQ